MWSKYNDSFIRALFLTLCLSFTPRLFTPRLSVNLFLLVIVTVIFNQKLQVSLPPELLDRFVCPILLTRSPTISLFGSEHFILIVFVSLVPPRFLFRGRCGSRLASIRSLELD